RCGICIQTPAPGPFGFVYGTGEYDIEKADGKTRNDSRSGRRLRSSPASRRSSSAPAGAVPVEKSFLIAVGAVYDRAHSRICSTAEWEIAGGHRPPLQLFYGASRTISDLRPAAGDFADAFDRFQNIGK